MLKSKFASVLAVPAGGVWLFDSFIANMPLVVEGGLFVAGIAATAMGWEGCKKLIHSATAEKEDKEQAPEWTNGDAAAWRAQNPQYAPPPADPYALPSHRAAELLQAFQMGADAQAAQERVHVQPTSVRRLER